ncbi:MAG: hypothetical protein ACKOTZ_06795 [Chloroflexota bacterium]
MPRRSPLAILAALGALALLVPALPAGAQVPRATDGSRCTIVGTERADTLRGTRRADVICGLGGNDRILAGAGRDTIDGDAGADTIAGEGGSDLVLGGDGPDTLSGGAAADRVVGGAGIDAITATPADTCAAPGDDTLTGACTPDTDPPVISDVAVPADVAPGTPLVITWRATDATGVGILDDGPASWIRLSGAPGWITWCGFTIASERVSGDALDGRYRATCTVPDLVPNGEYGVDIGAYDLGGVSATEYGRSGFSFRISAGSADQEAPAVTEVARIGAVPGPGGTLVLEWRAMDATGIDYVLPWVSGPNGRLTTEAGTLWFAMGSDPVLLSGSGTDGRYRAELPADAALAPGTYRVWFSGRDTLGNRFYDAGPDRSGYLVFVVPG